MRRAFRVWIERVTDVPTIIAASTRGQARYLVRKQAMDAGYKVDFQDVTVRRCPEHDAWAAVDATRIGWDEKYMPSRKSITCSY